MFAGSPLGALPLALRIAISVHRQFTLRLARFTVVVHLWNVITFHHDVKTFDTTNFVVVILRLEACSATFDADQINSTA